MIRRLVAALLACSTPVWAARAAAAPSLAGTWIFDAARSTPLAGWETLGLTIAVDGPRVTLTRRAGNESRVAVSVLPLDLDQPQTRVAVPWWIDNRDIGAYRGGDHSAVVRARWLDDGRVLRTEEEIALSTQQGDHPVDILADYHLSQGGRLLTVIELRSTRDLPIVYVFHRAP